MSKPIFIEFFNELALVLFVDVRRVQAISECFHDSTKRRFTALHLDGNQDFVVAGPIAEIKQRIDAAFEEAKGGDS